jgi:hypothetical protein
MDHIIDTGALSQNTWFSALQSAAKVVERERQRRGVIFMISMVQGFDISGVV